MKLIDIYLNKITMYRITLYYLIFLVLCAFVLGIFGFIAGNPFHVLLNSLVAITVCWSSNWFFAKLFKATTNIESIFITALILTLIIPVEFPLNAIFIVAVSVIAMASKYLLTIEKKHIFNPAAISILLYVLLFPEQPATWWIGTPVMIIPTVLGGLLVMRKTRRERMIISFLVSYMVLISVGSLVRFGSLESLFSTVRLATLQTALFYFAFVMLTEPLTSPATKKLQTYFAVLVAFIYSTPHLRLFGVTYTPEWALVIGNVFAYLIEPRYRLVLFLKEKIQLTKDTVLFNFGKIDKFFFTPGQYLEWTLDHKNADSRGNRRYFSIASSPQEELQLLVKFYTPSSTFKQHLLSLPIGGSLVASHLAGDFILPKDTTKPLAFIAGGVGIAPFRSMIEEIIERQHMVDIVILFANKTKDDILFEKTFERALTLGVKTTYVLTDKECVPAGFKGEVGHIDEERIKKVIPDFAKRTFYISGPQLMVQSFEKVLENVGIPKRRTVVDFFPGYMETK